MWSETPSCLAIPAIHNAFLCGAAGFRPFLCLRVCLLFLMLTLSLFFSSVSLFLHLDRPLSRPLCPQLGRDEYTYSPCSNYRLPPMVMA